MTLLMTVYLHGCFNTSPENSSMNCMKCIGARSVSERKLLADVGQAMKTKSVAEHTSIVELSPSQVGFVFDTFFVFFYAQKCQRSCY